MKSITKSLIYTLLAGVFSVQQSNAQQADTTYADLNYIRRSNAWLSSRNAAGLTTFSMPDLSDISAYFKKQDGGFKNYYESEDSQEYGLRAASVTRLNRKVVMAGGVSYQNFKGKQMSGSAFINPYEMPFDLVELDPANRGTKELELYHLDGAVGAQLSPRLSVGGRLNYEAGNYAKRKDLRHINKLLSMSTSVGLLYKFGELLELGMNYEYQRRIESISFKSYGNTDRQFLSLVNYGAFYGRQELFSQSGYTSSQNTNPLRDITQGGSLQLNFHLNNDVKFFNEFSYGDRKGFFGEEGTSSILLTRHQGTDWAYSGNLSIENNETAHHIGLKASINELTNSETIYRRATTAGGVNEIVYYGDNEVFSGENLHVGLDYSLFLGVKHFQPQWTIQVLADYLKRDQYTLLYPFFRNQEVKSYQVSGQISRNLQRARDAFSFGVGAGFSKGQGNISNDGVLVTPADSHLRPATMSQFMHEEYEYFTAAHLKGNLHVKYTKALQNGLGAYLKVNYAQTYAPKVSYLGKYQSAVTASIGCAF